MCLDEYLGRIKQPAIAINPPKSPKKVRQVFIHIWILPYTEGRSKKKHHPGRLDPALHHAANLPKPQLLFKRKPDNDNHSHWCPTLPHKYNAQVPLGYNYRDSDMDTDTEGPMFVSPSLEISKI
jgi:exosome complex exonuclease RRP6